MNTNLRHANECFKNTDDYDKARNIVVGFRARASSTSSVNFLIVDGMSHYNDGHHISIEMFYTLRLKSENS